MKGFDSSSTLYLHLARFTALLAVAIYAGCITIVLLVIAVAMMMIVLSVLPYSFVQLSKEFTTLVVLAISHYP